MAAREVVVFVLPEREQPVGFDEEDEDEELEDEEEEELELEDDDELYHHDEDELELEDEELLDDEELGLEEDDDGEDDEELGLDEELEDGELLDEEELGLDEDELELDIVGSSGPATISRIERRRHDRRLLQPKNPESLPPIIGIVGQRFLKQSMQKTSHRNSSGQPTINNLSHQPSTVKERLGPTHRR
jgi:hypothetical protein